MCKTSQVYPTMRGRGLHGHPTTPSPGSAAVVFQPVRMNELCVFVCWVTEATGVMANHSVNGTSPDQGRTVDAAMATVYAVICVGGMVGHGLVLLVVSRDRQPNRAVSNSYIASLSAADIGFLLGLPFIIATLCARRWLFGATLCKASQGRIQKLAKGGPVPPFFFSPFSLPFLSSSPLRSRAPYSM